MLDPDHPASVRREPAVAVRESHKGLPGASLALGNLFLDCRKKLEER
jgi:hypothetical protein